ncbi:MAG: metallophosphoesterase [Phycisphaerae bacterium]
MSFLKRVGLIAAAWAWGVCAFCPAADASADLAVQAEAQANPWTHLALNNEPDRFQFAIVADRTGGRRPAVFAQAIERLNLLQPEFVMSIGDLIDGYTEDEAAIDAQWDEFEKIVERLEMSFFYVPGNHDITNAVMAAKWRERFGRSYYHFVYRGVLFVCLNTEDPPATHISDAQVAYVARALAEAGDVRWTLVFMHKPLWVIEESAKAKGEEVKTGWLKVEALLKDRPYTVFAGHFHTYTMHERLGRRYFVLATTGGGSTLQGPRFGQFDHVVWVTMTDKGPRLANLTLEGVLDEAVVTKESLEQVRALSRAVIIETGPLLVEGDTFDGAETKVTVHNEADIPLRFQAVFGLHAHLLVNPRAFSFVVPPKGSRSAAISIRVEEPSKVADLAPLALEWSYAYKPADQPPIEADGVRRLVVDRAFDCPRRRDPVVVDGRLGEWKDLPFECRTPALLLHDPAAWDGPEDCGFRFAVAYDERFLYLAIETTDDRFIRKPGKPVWVQDGVEIRLDARPEAQRARLDWSGILTILVGPGETPEKTLRRDAGKWPKGTKAVCVQTGTGHVTEVAIPASYLNGKQGGAWNGFRLSIAVDDFDEPGEQGAQVWWRPAWWHKEDYAGSGLFRRR